jgi:hypothetical protein
MNQIDRALVAFKEELEKIEESLDLDSDSSSHKPHLIARRIEILKNIENIEKLKGVSSDARGPNKEQNL